MKNKKTVLIGLMIVVIALIIVGVIYFSKSEKNGYVPEVTKKEITVESENPDSYKYIKNIDGAHLFYLGLDKIEIDGQDLLEFINTNDIKSLEKYFNKVETYKDGGSKLYTCDDTKKCDDDIKVLFCNTLSGDRDIYISTRDYNLTADYCNTEAEEPNDPDETGEEN